MVSSNSLQRTFRMKVGNSVGTCFTIDIEGRQYIVTASHCLPDLGPPQSPYPIELMYQGAWMSFACLSVGAANGNVDIAVLAPPHRISPSHPLVATSHGVCLSQDVFFLGFPLGLQADLGAINNNFPLPLVKKACVSLISGGVGQDGMFLLDGHNNPGFSGGPVVFAAPPAHMAESVAAVVSAYHIDMQPVLIGGQPTGLSAQGNSGIVIAYAIDYAVALINATPIGALLPA